MKWEFCTGTSPLYTFSGILGGGVPATVENVEGAASLIFWTLTGIVCIKYALIVLRADDSGQGMAPLQILQQPLIYEEPHGDYMYINCRRKSAWCCHLQLDQTCHFLWVASIGQTMFCEMLACHYGVLKIACL